MKTVLKSITLLLTMCCVNQALACRTIPSDLWALTEVTAERYGLEPALLGALVWQESRYCVQAVSPAGALGLGQLMPATAKMLGVDPLNPEQNLDGAARYLRQQYQRFGRWSLALAAYNAGPGEVLQYDGIPPNWETQAYVPSVLTMYAQLRDNPPFMTQVRLAPPLEPTQIPSDLETPWRTLAQFRDSRPRILFGGTHD